MENEIKHIPMLFSTPMMRANLAGTKEKTRRKCNDFIQNYAIEINRLNSGTFQIETVNDRQILKPKIKIGDVIWCRETFAVKGQRIFYKADNDSFENAGLKGLYDFVWKPSLFMPKHACRLWLCVKRGN
jgi:hypothetical protein